MQRVSEGLKLAVIVERGWSFVVKRQCAYTTISARRIAMIGS
jgi:hypothetical protein